MCRSIKKLRQPERPATVEEIRAAALQYVRKVSGFRAPSTANRAAFERAIEEISAATDALLASLPPARATSAQATSTVPSISPTTAGGPHPGTAPKTEPRP